MIVAMKALMTKKPLLYVAALLLAFAGAADAQSIYKCTKGGQVTYTDRPCAGGNGEVIHKADDADIIDQYLRLGQVDLAKRYADSHHLDALYQQRLLAHQQAAQEEAQRKADEAYAAQQRDEQARQQAMDDEAANRERLQAENEALRQQNAEYQDQLAQPVYNAPPAYWDAVPSYGYGDRRRDHDRGHHDHAHDPRWRPPSKGPVFHPCTQLAGGRVQC
jgi:hypothetical protein